MKQVRRETERLGQSPKECAGIDLNAAKQLAVLGELAHYYGEIPFPERPSPPARYYYQNDFFRHADAIVLFTMMRRLQPKRIVEVGSGFSSAAMLDTNEAHFGSQVQFTFIEPFPGRLLSLLTEHDRQSVAIVRRPVQELDPSLFDSLDRNDILFIDSSHVVKLGSDVQYLIEVVLPRIRPGVVIHFHDVLWPFRYPFEWTLSGNAWNEAYFLRAFLQYNAVFEIEYFNSYMEVVHGDSVQSRMPLCLKGAGGSLWLRRTG
jgi:predicted O-methyltransferase YrrM